MTLAFMQCTKSDTHYMNIYLNKLKIENIDGAVKCPKLHHADMISNNLLSFQQKAAVYKVQMLKKVSQGGALETLLSQIEY